MQYADLETIRDTVTQSSQGWTREATVRWSGHKIRASIYRDSYDKQSRIKAEIFSPTDLRWNQVISLDGHETAAGLPSAYSVDKAKAKEATEYLVDQLITYAQELLSE